ncbi:hypothetical protein [Paracoccus sp. (in: a-proteobacteria)]|uniref:hypothetical protein n=1 Tax=Paracoccus sp. TaxID=267 RepID=UPI00272AAF91|nr:hypothetical protein [Paracoccus sp. (in: a-proteobacteria)]
MSLTIPVPVLLAAVALSAAVLVCAWIMRARRRSAAAASQAQEAEAEMSFAAEAPMTALALRIELLGDQLQAQDQRRQAEAVALRDDLNALRSDVEWLTSERMIEQAIAMCREGLPNHEIGDTLGLSSDTVRTIRLLRTH